MTKNDINCCFVDLIPIDFVGKEFYICTRNQNRATSDGSQVLIRHPRGSEDPLEKQTDPHLREDDSSCLHNPSPKPRTSKGLHHDDTEQASL